VPVMTAAIRAAKRATFVVGCISIAACSKPPATLTIDATERHQTMAGWEATTRAWEFDKSNDRFDGSWVAQRNELAAMLADDAGIDRLRLEIKSGIENPVDYWALFASGRLSYQNYRKHFYEKINDNADPAVLDPAGIQFSDLDWHVENMVLPVKQRVEARGRRFRLNLAYVDFAWTEAKGTLSHANNAAEYAELVVASFSHLKTKYGLVPDSLEIVIEPDNSDGWGGIEIGKAIVAVAARLDAAGFPNVEIIAPSTAKAQRGLNYFRDIRRVPGAAQRMKTLAYHRYDGEPDASELNDIRDAAQAARMSTAMLEYGDRDIAAQRADLSDGNANAWQQYGIATRLAGNGDLRPGWLIVVRSATGARPAFALSPVARALALVFNAVDQGCVRIGARSSDDDLAAVGFITPKQKLVVVVNAQADVPLTVAGLRHGRYRLIKITRGGTDPAPSEIPVNGPLNLPVIEGTTYALVEL